MYPSPIFPQWIYLTHHVSAICWDALSVRAPCGSPLTSPWLGEIGVPGYGAPYGPTDASLPLNLGENPGPTLGIF